MPVPVCHPGAWLGWFAWFGGSRRGSGVGHESWFCQGHPGRLCLRPPGQRASEQLLQGGWPMTLGMGPGGSSLMLPVPACAMTLIPAWPLLLSPWSSALALQPRVDSACRALRPGWWPGAWLAEATFIPGSSGKPPSPSHPPLKQPGRGSGRAVLLGEVTRSRSGRNEAPDPCPLGPRRGFQGGAWGSLEAWPPDGQVQHRARSPRGRCCPSRTGAPRGWGRACLT